MSGAAHSRAGTRLARWLAPALAAVALAAADPALGDAAGVQAFQRGDFEDAYELLLPDAERGDAQAQTLVANMLRTGRGVARDYAAAVAWYRKAATQGNPLAQYNLAVHLREGLGVERDEVETTKWFRRSAQQGFLAAQINLGIRYARGQGTERDLVRGYAWLQRAASTGNSEARHKRDIVARELSPEQLREGRRLSYKLY